MLIRNLQFFEQVDNGNDIQGGASVNGFALADTYRDKKLSLAVGSASVVSKGDYNSYGITDTNTGTSPYYAYSTAYYAGSAVDKNGKYALDYDLKYSIS